jgi:ABC-type lipoprotein release transport system permease subunit
VLPSFLATQVAMEDANFEATVRQNIGAPADLQAVGFFPTPEEQERNRLNTQFRTRELAAVPGIDQTVGLTYGYDTSVADTVGFKGANFTVYGVDGFLNDVLFTNLMEFVAGGPEALDALLEDPQAIIISEGLAEHLAVTMGDTVKVQGEGTDHVVNARIIAVARKIPSLDGISRSRTTAEFGSDALMSLDGFRALITPLNEPLPAQDARLLQRIAITLTPEASPDAVMDEIGDRFRGDHVLWIRSLEVQIEENQRNQAVQRIFLLVLTIISFTTAVFGVFAVIYVTIYSRRIEIGMMKAIGMRRRELTGMLIVESITMTLGAALAGIAAGATMGYIAFYGDRALSQRPADFAFDTTVVPFIVIMVTLASILGAAFSARRIVTKRAIEILRM